MMIMRINGNAEVIYNGERCFSGGNDETGIEGIEQILW